MTDPLQVLHAGFFCPEKLLEACTFLLVWMTVNRGKKPCAIACLTIWKAALMRAWLAMMDAKVASSHKG